MTVVEQLENQQELFEQIADRMIRALRAGNKILWCGNGGSAADSQHLAAEIVGRFRRERRGLASIALTILLRSATTTDTRRFSRARLKPSVRPATSWSGSLLPAIARMSATPFSMRGHWVPSRLVLPAKAEANWLQCPTPACALLHATQHAFRSAISCLVTRCATGSNLRSASMRPEVAVQSALRRRPAAMMAA